MLFDTYVFQAAFTFADQIRAPRYTDTASMFSPDRFFRMSVLAPLPNLERRPSLQ